MNGRLTRRATWALLVLFVTTPWCAGAEPAAPKADTSRGDQMLRAYFRGETAELAQNCLADIKTLDDWQAKRADYRRQLFEMLGLDPLPEKTDLKATTTGTVEADE